MLQDLSIQSGSAVVDRCTGASPSTNSRQVSEAWTGDLPSSHGSGIFTSLWSSMGCLNCQPSTDTSSSSQTYTEARDRHAKILAAEYTTKTAETIHQIWELSLKSKDIRRKRFKIKLVELTRDKPFNDVCLQSLTSGSQRRYYVNTVDRCFLGEDGRDWTILEMEEAGTTILRDEDLASQIYMASASYCGRIPM